MIGNLTHPQMEEVLVRNIFGRLSCSVNNEPYAVPVNYIYHEGKIFAHSQLGKKIRIMRENPRVCFLIDEIDDYSKWRSVIVYGDYEELTEEKDQYEAMKLFVDRVLHLKISETAAPPEVTGNRIHPRSPGNIKPVVYRITIREMTGRFEKSDANNP